MKQQQTATSESMQLTATKNGGGATKQAISSGLLSGNNVQVVIRVRPLQDSYQMNGVSSLVNNNTSMSYAAGLNNQSLAAFRGPNKRCINEIRDKKAILLPLPGNGSETFNFDFVGAEDIAQEEIFNMVGRPIVDSCLQGYNGSIFAYGQTGSGKTYTIQGRGFDSCDQDRGDKSQRGLLPRCFEYLFSQICKIKNTHLSQIRGNGKRSARSSTVSSNLPKLEEHATSVEFDVRCQYLEIYNEVIIDLLDPSQMKVQIRETAEKGVYPEPCTEESVSSISEVMELINRGSRNRHVGCTNMNAESSRSHGIFTAIIKMTQSFETGESFIKTSRFHIVDLAGSERTKDTGAEGQRLKEAGAINKSLTVLGQVIYDLSEQNNFEGTKAGKTKHIRYRESKLTHLLRDALGGNSKTVMICNVNPHIDALRETRSTLQFAQRAKMIKCAAVVNEENTSAQYWKDRYFKELAIHRANTLPAVSEGSSVKSATNPCAKCSKGLNLQSSSPCDQLKVDVGLVQEAHSCIKELTQSLKEEKEKREDAEISFRNAVQQLDQTLKNQNLAFKLKQQYFSKISEQLNLVKIEGEALPEKGTQDLRELLKIYREENDELKRLVLHNPHLAMKTSMCMDLERRFAELQQHMNKQSSDISSCCSKGSLLDQVLSHLDKSFASMKSLQKQVEQLIVAQNQDSSSIMNGNLMDIDEGNGNIGRDSLMPTRSFNDYSVLTQRRDQELANIKLKYEEQIECLKTQLKREQATNQKFINFISQKTNNFHSQVPSATQNHLHGDIDLLSSQVDINAALSMNLGPLNNTQAAYLNTAPGAGPSRSSMERVDSQSTPKNSSRRRDDSSSILIVDHQAQQQQQQLPNEIYEEMLAMMNDVQKKSTEDAERITILELQIEERIKEIAERDSRIEEGVKERVALMQEKCQIEDQLECLQQKYDELNDESQQILERLQELEKIQEDYDNLKTENQQLRDDNASLQSTNEIFSTQTIPELRQQINHIDEQFQRIISERDDARQKASKLAKQLQEAAQDKNQQNLISELQLQVATLQQANTEHEHLQKLTTEELQKHLAQVTNMSTHISRLQESNSEHLEKLKLANEETQRLKSENESQANQIQDSNTLISNYQKSNQYQKEKIENLEQEKQATYEKTRQLFLQKEDRIAHLRGEILKCESEKDLIRQELAVKERELKAKLAEASEANAKLKHLLETTMEKSQFAFDAFEALSRAKRNSNMLNEKIENERKKLLEENRNLRDLLISRQTVIENLESKAKVLEIASLQQSDGAAKIKTLERDRESLRNQVKFFETHVLTVETECQQLKQANKELQKRYDDLDKQYLSLMQGGDNSTTRLQHFSHLKSQNNTSTKQLMQVQGELLARKKELERVEQRLSEVVGMLNEFGEAVVCRVMKMNKATAFKPCGGGLKPDLANLKEFIETLQDIVQQGCTNIKLQLETPFNGMSQNHQQQIPKSTGFFNNNPKPQSNNASLLFFNPDSKSSSSDEPSSSSMGSSEEQFRVFQDHPMELWKAPTFNAQPANTSTSTQPQQQQRSSNALANTSLSFAVSHKVPDNKFSALKGTTGGGPTSTSQQLPFTMNTSLLNMSSAKKPAPQGSGGGNLFLQKK